MRGRNETLKKRVRLVRFTVEFGMELAADEEGMLGQFDDFDQLPIGSKTAKDKAGFFKLRAVAVVKFVAMAMAFIDHKGAIEPLSVRPHDELARLGPHPHGAAFFGDPRLLIEHGDDRIGCARIELGGMRVIQLQHITRKFDRSDLHS